MNIGKLHDLEIPVVIKPEISGIFLSGSRYSSYQHEQSD
jgi:ligand-binding sensor protein